VNDVAATPTQEDTVMSIRPRFAVALACAAGLVLAAVASPATVAAKPGHPDKGQPDARAMQEMMAKAAAPGPNHEILRKLNGEWDVTIRVAMDPSRPMEESKGTSVVTGLMDGRYSQEVTTATMGGMPMNGLGLTGYDNVARRFVSTWVDNMGTGIMMSEGKLDADGTTIRWTARSLDPATGKPVHYRMVTRFKGDDKHTYEMFGPGHGGKESRMMELTYERKK
jgi:hypothetical protein